MSQIWKGVSELKPIRQNNDTILRTHNFVALAKLHLIVFFAVLILPGNAVFPKRHYSFCNGNGHFESSYDNKVITLNLVMELQPINYLILAQNYLNFLCGFASKINCIMI